MRRTIKRDCFAPAALLRPSERMLGLFADTGILKYTEADAFLLGGFKVFDFMVAPGGVSAKVMNGSSRLEKVDIIKDLSIWNGQEK